MDVFQLHAQNTGKISITPTIKVESRETLSLVYTPQVAKICTDIAQHPENVKKYTMSGKMVAVISDGSAVLGLGNIGAKAALPVMEGKCVIFKEFGGLDAFPICIDEQDPEKLIATIKSIACNFAAINLEDISAPRCFTVEKRLQDELDIPIMHDDQHGTAIVTTTALKGAIKLTKKKNLKVLIVGAGAAGTAILKLLNLLKTELDITELRIVDSTGLIASDRDDLNEFKKELAEITGQKKTLPMEEAVAGTDVFIGVSAAGILTPEMIKTMNPDPIIFAMANPTPEIMPEEAFKAGAKIVATGRSDYDNQINNALSYPGVFKGLIEGGFKKANDDIKVAAVKAIYNYHEAKLDEKNLLPSILDKEVPKVIAEAIKALKGN